MSSDLLEQQTQTRIVSGPGVLGQLGALAGALGGRRLLVVSDRGVVSAGHAQSALVSIQGAGFAVELYDGVEENPTAAHVRQGVQRAREFEPDLLVGLGGGSAAIAAAERSGTTRGAGKLLPRCFQ